MAPEFDEFALKHLPRLRRVLRAMFPRTPGDFVTEAVHDALLDHLAGPGRRDPPSKDRIQSYLSVAARRNLMDILRAEKRRRHREDVYGMAASRAAPLNTAFRQSDDLRRRIRVLVSNPAEERALFLWAEDAPLEQLAVALGCSQLPAAEQRAEVKRLIDRIRRRARREGC